MKCTTLEGQIRPEEPLIIQIGVRAVGEDDLTEEIDGFGIIDTASKQCVINAGVLHEDYFAQDGAGGLLVDGIGRKFDSRHCEMIVRLRQNGIMKEFQVPLYEMSLGLFPRGTPAVLIGRTILDQGVLVYDGTNQKWTMTFSDG